MNHIRRIVLCNGHVHRIKHQLCSLPGAHGPADDTAAESIQHDSQIQKARPGRHEGGQVEAKARLETVFQGRDYVVLGLPFFNETGQTKTDFKAAFEDQAIEA